MTAPHLTARLRGALPASWRERASPGLEYVAAPLVARHQVRRFVIVCGPRTGSELLRELLDSLPDVQCEGELLQKGKRWPVAYLNGRAALGGRDRLAWGCKILDAHLHLGLVESRPPGDRLLAELVADGWTVVHLRRRDLLAQALSYLHATHGEWHFRRSAAFEPFEADTAEVIALLHVLDGNARWLDERLGDVPHSTISYEDDLRPPDRRNATLGRLAGLLGVPSSATSTDLKAVAPAQAEKRITNFDELSRALAHTRFASLVVEPPTEPRDA